LKSENYEAGFVSMIGVFTPWPFCFSHRMTSRLFALPTSVIWLKLIKKTEFDRRNVKVMGLSFDLLGESYRLGKDIEETQGHAPN